MATASLRLRLLVGCGGEKGRLARTDARDEREGNRLAGVRVAQHRALQLSWLGAPRQAVFSGFGRPARSAARQDRKSTRLNSSHVAISYAVFCLKKKKQKQ